MGLIRTKTFWAGLTAIATAAGGYFTNELTAAAAINMVFTGIIGIFLRDGMIK